MVTGAQLAPERTGTLANLKTGLISQVIVPGSSREIRLKV